jgi:hypothetical protein
MLPHLGVFASYNEDAALEILFSSCIIPLGTVISPIKTTKKINLSENIADIELSNGIKFRLKGLSIRKVPLSVKESCSVTIKPLRKDLDFGSGRGKLHTCTVEGGEVGIIFDTRGGSSNINNLNINTSKLQREWNEELGINII